MFKGSNTNAAHLLAFRKRGTETKLNIDIFTDDNK